MIRRLSVAAAGMFLGLVFAVCLWRSRGGDGVLLVLGRSGSRNMWFILPAGSGVGR